MKNTKPSPMDRAKIIFEKSGLSLDELGRRMGYTGDVARKSAWQFLKKTADPRLSMLKKFAEAMNINLADLVR
jgi:transcriptional regulator with XRE-family HTH domain